MTKCTAFVLFLLLGALPVLMAQTATTFEGIDAAQLSNPGLDIDPNGAVGTKQFMEWVNSSYQAYDKVTFAPVWSTPQAGTTPWKNSGLNNCSVITGDGYISFDRLASRWVVSARTTTSNNYHYCIAVSNTDDLTSTSLAWFAYDISLNLILGTNPQGSVYFPDWPKLGTWADSYYVGIDIEDPGNNFREVGVVACALDRTNMLIGGTARAAQCFRDPATSSGLYLKHSLIPADVEGTTPPPVGRDEYLVSVQNPVNDGVSTTTNSFNLWDFHVDWNNPANSTFTQSSQSVAQYTPGCYNAVTPSQTLCVPESSTGTTGIHIDSVGDRFMPRFSYWNFGSYESFLTSQTIQVGTGSSKQTGIRWYELRGSGTPTVFQTGTVNPDSSLFRFIPSIAQDKDAEAAVGYSVSSGSTHPGLRSSWWSLASLTAPSEFSLFSGSGDEQNSGQWGDYSSMTVDPIDGCTFWYVNEYFTQNQTGSQRVWKTRISNFKLPGCGGVTLLPASGLVFGSVAQGNTSTAQTATLTNGQNITLNINSIGFTGTNGADFAETDTCGSTLAAGTNCSINVTFTPGALGARSAVLNVTDDAGSSPQTISVSGTGVAPVTLSSASLTFGNVVIGTSTTAPAVTLTNNQNVPLTNISISAVAPFGQVNTCGTTIAAGAQCKITVTFSPTVTGAQSGTVTISDSAVSSPQTITVKGTGVNPVTFSPTSLNFGGVPVGTSSNPMTTTLTNRQKIALNITSIAITGVNSGDFSQNNTCPSSVAAGGSCTITVTFTPHATGTRSANVKVTDDASTSPQSVKTRWNGPVGPTGTCRNVALWHEWAMCPGASFDRLDESIFNIADKSPNRPSGKAASRNSLPFGSTTLEEQMSSSCVLLNRLSRERSTGREFVLGSDRKIGLFMAFSKFALMQSGVLIALLMALSALPLNSQVSVLTGRNDNGRSASNNSESFLNSANVNSTTFAKLGAYNVDGYAVAQPLYMASLSINGTPHDVVFVATAHNSVYAFDADNLSSGLPLWQVNLGTSVPIAEQGCAKVNGYTEVGIQGTPVIDSATNTLYVDVKTKEIVGGITSYVHRLHALDVTNGQEKFGGPVQVTGSVQSVHGLVTFDSTKACQRPGLLLSNGTVYIGFGSNGCDTTHGWVFAYNASSLAQVGIFNSSPNQTRGASIWQGGAGLAGDDNGNVFFLTANGAFNANTGGSDFGDSFLKLTLTGGTLGWSDYFTPYDQANMNTNDLDLGSGGVMVLANPHVAIGAGKTGTIYVVNPDNMGHYQTNDNSQIIQWLQNAINEVDATPAYWNSMVFFAPNHAPALSYMIGSDGKLSPTSKQTAPIIPVGGPVMSANGNSNGIMWLVRKFGSSAMQLSAYDAAKMSEIYNTTQATGNRDSLGTTAHFVVPTVANGKVFVGTQTQLAVYGLMPQLSATSGGNQTGAAGSTLPLPLTVQATDPYSGAPLPGVTVTFTGKGTFGNPTAVTDSTGTASTTYTLPTTFTISTITISVTSAGYASATFTETVTAGSPASISLISGGSQTGVAGTTLPSPLVFKVADQYGNAVTGTSVSFSDTPNHGGFSGNPVTTDSSGKATVSYTLPTKAGYNTINATSGSVTSPGVQERAVAGPASSLTIVSGNNQTAKTNTLLPGQLKVKVTDQYGNVISGVTVTYSDNGANGIFSSTTAITNSSGVAAVSYTTPSQPGTVTITVSITGLSPVTFTVNVT